MLITSAVFLAPLGAFAGSAPVSSVSKTVPTYKECECVPGPDNASKSEYGTWVLQCTDTNGTVYGIEPFYPPAGGNGINLFSGNTPKQECEVVLLIYRPQ
jgi:hypothetical protein